MGESGSRLKDGRRVRLRCQLLRLEKGKCRLDDLDPDSLVGVGQKGPRVHGIVPLEGGARKTRVCVRWGLNEGYGTRNT